MHTHTHATIRHAQDFCLIRMHAMALTRAQARHLYLEVLSQDATVKRPCDDIGHGHVDVKRQRMMESAVAQSILQPVVVGGSCAMAQRHAAAVVKECGAASCSTATVKIAALGSRGRHTANLHA